MKTNINFKRASRLARFPYSPVIKSLFFSALILTCLQMPLQAQMDSVKYTTPSWWFGVAGGANFNFYRGTTQQLNNDLTVPAAFLHGNGVGLYLGPLIEFHRPDSR